MSNPKPYWYGALKHMFDIARTHYNYSYVVERAHFFQIMADVHPIHKDISKYSYYAIVICALFDTSIQQTSLKAMFCTLLKGSNV